MSKKGLFYETITINKVCLQYNIKRKLPFLVFLSMVCQNKIRKYSPDARVSPHAVGILLGFFIYAQTKEGFMVMAQYSDKKAHVFLMENIITTLFGR